MQRIAYQFDQQVLLSLVVILLATSPFLDDIFSILNITNKQLHQLLEEINKIHPNIKGGATLQLSWTTKLFFAAHDAVLPLKLVMANHASI